MQLFAEHFDIGALRAHADLPEGLLLALCERPGAARNFSAAGRIMPATPPPPAPAPAPAKPKNPDRDSTAATQAKEGAKSPKPPAPPPSKTESRPGEGGKRISMGSPATPAPKAESPKPQPDAKAEQRKGANIDAKLTPAARAERVAAQKQLEANEAAVRERRKSGVPAPAPAGDKSGATLAPPAPAGGKPASAAAGAGANAPDIMGPVANRPARPDAPDPEIVELRRQHVAKYPEYIDADGTAYAASVANDGAIQLERDEARAAEKDRRATKTERRGAIGVDRTGSRSTTTATVPTGTPNEVNEIQASTVNLKADGSVRDSQRRRTTAQTGPDGTTKSVAVEENHGGDGLLTKKVESKGSVTADGAARTESGTTVYRADGQTIAQTVQLDAAAQGKQTTAHEVTVDFASDGARPTSQLTVDGGTDAGGSALVRTSARTQFNDAGAAATTYIAREGAYVERNVPRSEHVTWAADGQIARRASSDQVVAELGFEQHERLTRPPMRGDDLVLKSGPLSTIRERSPDELGGGEDPRQWTRVDPKRNRFEGQAVSAGFGPPLIPAQDVPNLFELSTSLRTRAIASTIEGSPPATDPAAFRKLEREQQAYEKSLTAATSEQQREALMRDYLATHSIWIDRAAATPGAAAAPPVLLAAAWSQGEPPSAMFGAERATRPHAALARTGETATPPDGSTITEDYLRNVYTDLSTDQIIRTARRGTDGASDEKTAGEHRNAAGVLTESDSHTTSTRPRVTEGLEPLTTTEIARERFDGTSGKPSGEQYYATASTDSKVTNLREQRDVFGADGIIDTTDVAETSRSRDFSQETVSSFVAANEFALAQARIDKFNPNTQATSITTPPAGSFSTSKLRHVDYDAAGQGVLETEHETSQSVQATTDEVYDKSGKLISQTPDPNGVKLTTVDVSRERSAGGAPIFDAQGQPIVDQKVRNTVKTMAFDPDDGTAGGHNKKDGEAGHQWREFTEVTTGSTVKANGATITDWVSPFKSQVLQEGYDDDWGFEEKLIKTELNREPGGPPYRVVTDSKGKPIALKAGEKFIDATGVERTQVRDSTIRKTDLDGADNFEKFMEDYGSKIAMYATIAAGVGLAFTGAGSAAGIALIAAGLTLSSAQFAKTALDHSQGEASTLNLVMDGIGVAGFAVSGIQGLRALKAAQLARGGGAASAAGRAASAGTRAAGAAAGEVDDAARGLSLAQRAGQTARNATVGRVTSIAEDPLSTVHLLGDAGDVYDASQAAKAAYNGDWSQAALFVGGLGANAVAGRAGRNWRATNSFDSPRSRPAPPPPQSTSTASGAPPVAARAARVTSSSVPLYGAQVGGTPPVVAGAPAVRVSTATNGSSTGASASSGSTGRTGNSASPAGSESTVGGARGQGDASPGDVAPAAGAAVDAGPVGADGAPVRATNAPSVGAVGSPAGAPRFASGDVQMQDILAHGTLFGGANGRLPTRGAPNSVSFNLDASGEVSGYAVIGSDGKTALAVRRSVDGDWMTIEPTMLSNGASFVDLKSAGRPANSQEIPSLPGNAEVLAAARARSAEIRASAPSDVAVAPLELGHVLRVHHPDFRVEADGYGITDGGVVRDGVQSAERYGNKSLFDSSIPPERVRDMINDAVANGVWTKKPHSSEFRVIQDLGTSIGVDANGNPVRRLQVDVKANGTIRSAYPVGDAALRSTVLSDAASVQALVNSATRARTRGADSPAGTAPAAGDLPANGRKTTNTTGAKLEPPLPRSREVIGGLEVDVATAGDLLVGQRVGDWVVRSVNADGSLNLRLQQSARVDELIALNPELVSRMGGEAHVRQHPRLLAEGKLRAHAADGSIHDDFRFRGDMGGNALVTRSETRTAPEVQAALQGGVDVGAMIVARQRADASFDGRAALIDIIRRQPGLLDGRPLRLRRSDSAIAQGRVAHNIDDGWVVQRRELKADGTELFGVDKDYAFESLPPASRQAAAAAGYGPGQIVTFSRKVTLDQIVDYNRARLEGDHGQLPKIRVFDGARPGSAEIGVGRDIAEGDLRLDADQAVVHTQAALDYMYSRYGYVPSGGQLKLVINDSSVHNNATMDSVGNVLRIGTHEGTSASFDPGVIAHELGHKMIADLTLGAYGDTQAGAIHEGFADVMSAAWTGDSVIGRTFGSDGQVIRDIHSGAELIGTRQGWDAANAAGEGVGAHRGSGVISGTASRIADIQIVDANGMPTRLGWAATGDLFHQALRSGGMSKRMDFDTFSDSVRVAAGQRYGNRSAEFAEISRALDAAGLVRRPAPGDTVSRLTDRKTVEGGWSVVHVVPGGDMVVLRNSAGKELLFPASRILNGDGAGIRLDASGNPTFDMTVGSGNQAAYGAQRLPRASAIDGTASSGQLRNSAEVAPPAAPAPWDMVDGSVGGITDLFIGSDGMLSVGDSTNGMFDLVIGGNGAPRFGADPMIDLGAPARNDAALSGVDPPPVVRHDNGLLDFMNDIGATARDGGDVVSPTGARAADTGADALASPPFEGDPALNAKFEALAATTPALILGGAMRIAPPSIDAQQWDLTISRTVVSGRTPEALAYAQRLDAVAGHQYWVDQARRVDAARPPGYSGPSTELILRHALGFAAGEHGLVDIRRPRPSHFDPRIQDMSSGTTGSPLLSSRSAVANIGSTILASADPRNAASYRSLADDISRSGVISGGEFASDVQTGARFGTVIANRYLNQSGMPRPDVGSLSVWHPGDYASFGTVDNFAALADGRVLDAVPVNTPARHARDVVERAFQTRPVGDPRPLGHTGAEGQLQAWTFVDPVTGAHVEGIYKSAMQGGPQERLGGRLAAAFGLANDIPVMVKVKGGGAYIEVLPGQTFGDAGVFDEVALRNAMAVGMDAQGLSSTVRNEIWGAFHNATAIDDAHHLNGTLDVERGDAYRFDFGMIANGQGRTQHTVLNDFYQAVAYNPPDQFTDAAQFWSGQGKPEAHLRHVRLSPEAIAYLQQVDTDAIRAAHADFVNEQRPTDGQSLAGLRYDRAATPEFLNGMLSRLEQARTYGTYTFMDDMSSRADRGVGNQQ